MVKKIEWRIKPGDAFKCEQINEIVDIVNELIELDNRKNLRWRRSGETLPEDQWVKCGKDMGVGLNPPLICQGVLLPIEKPKDIEIVVSDLKQSVVHTEKYWKCSLCSREVK
jgi:hypothetical protein